MSAFSINIILLHSFVVFRNGRWNNVNIMITLTDLKYCFSGSLTITEFLLLSMVILEEYVIRDRYVSEILKQFFKQMTQEQLMNNFSTPTDI